MVADALSRLAYPASKAFADVSIHGSEEDDRQMRELIEVERQEERECSIITVTDIKQAQQRLGNPPVTVAFTTRGGAKTNEDAATVTKASKKEKEKKAPPPKTKTETPSKAERPQQPKGLDEPSGAGSEAVESRRQTNLPVSRSPTSTGAELIEEFGN